MILQLLTGIHNLTTLLFGIFISAFFLGVKPIMKNFGKLLLFALVDVFFYWGINLFTGTAFANQLYPVLVHLPLILFLFLCYRYSLLSCCISVFSAYLCCQFSNWAGILAFSFYGLDWVYYLTRILTTCAVFYLLSRHLCLHQWPFVNWQISATGGCPRHCSRLFQPPRARRSRGR